MGYIPPPLPLSKEEWERNGGRDLRFEHWYKYSNPVMGIYYFIVEKILRRKVDIFKSKKGEVK